MCLGIYLLPFQAISQITATLTGGNWSATTTWVGGVVPSAGSSVTIPFSSTVSVNINTPIVNNVVVNGTLNIPNFATSTLSYSGNMTVSGSLNNLGGIIQTTNGRAFNITGTGSYRHEPMSVSLLDESIFIKSVETFSNTSSITIVKWFDMQVGLGDPTRVGTSNFGNVTLSVNDTNYWEQNGDFMNAGVKRIYGTLSVTAGTVSMDNGVGATTYQVFNDIIISGTGRIIFSSGANRPLILETNNFTDFSTVTNKPTIIQDNCFGYTQWNVAGNAILGHDFYGIIGTGTNFGGNLNVQITGNLSITGGTVGFVVKANAPFTLNVNGTTSISGSPSSVRFIDGNTGDLNFTTTNFTVSGGGSNILLGGNGLIPPYTGNPNIFVSNDFTINGTSYTSILDASVTTKKLRLRIGHDLIMSGASANFTVARSRGALTVQVGNNVNITAGKFIGQIDTLNTSLDSVTVGNTFMMNTTDISDYFRITYGDGNVIFRCTGPFTIQNSGTGLSSGFCGIYRGRGDMSFTALSSFNMSNGRFAGIYSNRADVVTGDFSFYTATNLNMSGGFFRGIDSRTVKNSSTITFYTGNLQYSGGNFSGYYASNDNNATANFTVNGILQITFTSAATDTFTFVGVYVVDSYVNTIKLNVSIAGNLNITGPAGTFISSVAMGRETISVLSEINISGGKNSFNSYPNSNLGNPHPVILTVGTNFSLNGGITYLSAHNDSLVATINGNLNVNLGELNVQAGYSPAVVNILGGYSQTGGAFNLHRNLTSPGTSDISVTINSNDDATGDFSQTGGVINFDNNNTSVRASLYIKSPIVTYGGTGSMTMALPGTNTDLGVIYYDRTGTTLFNRTSNTHSIQQIEQRIEPGCTLVVNTGNMQISSHSIASYSNSMLYVSDGAVLDLKGNQVFSNNLQANSGIISAGRLRLTRPQGLYDASANAAINATGGMIYRLQAPNSVVEYYGSDNQIVTGIGVGNAMFASQKYYNLEINFAGTPNTEFVYPTNIPDGRSVKVRNKLILTNGELNLDDDHNPVGGGRSIIIERDSVSAITYTNGYIRSEVYDSSASVIWVINSRTGAHKIPFGYNATSPIPFTFDLPSGDADTLIVSTYHTPAPDNIPYPPGVDHVNNLTGTDNSTYTVDRFWFLQVTGTAPTANLTFVVTPAEMTGIVSPRAQAWFPAFPGGWQFPVQGTQSNPVTGTYVLNANYFPMNWWTLAGLSNPLPVTLLDFSGDCDDENVQLTWVTSSELNNDHFTVMKSSNGSEYTSIGTVSGNGTTTSVNEYFFTDKDESAEPAYYKLVQTDFDGTSAEYGPVKVRACAQDPAFDVSLIQGIPDHMDVLIRAPHDDRFKITLYTLEGKPITSFDKEVTSGLNVVTLKTSNLASGLYLLRVESPSFGVTKKVVLGYLR